MEITDNTRLQLAIRAASEVAEAQGLSFDRAIVLRHRSNTIVHLYPTSVVTRVATTTGTVRQGGAWLAHEVAVSRHLVDVDAPGMSGD